MDPGAHHRLTALFVERLSADPDVLGVVALGSSSGIPPGPDRFSDHDLFVVTRPGAQERFRADPSWLPDAARLVLWHRETPHGLKAIWDDGHLAELAVFDLDELSAYARVNRARVLLDRADVAGRVEAARARTAAQPPVDLGWEAAQLVCALLVAGLRAARGERLSAGQFVRSHATGHFLRLLSASLPAAAGAVPDDLDPFRRVERGWPEVAQALESALARPVEEAAPALLELAAATFRPPAVPWPEAAAASVRARLRSLRPLPAPARPG